MEHTRNDDIKELIELEVARESNFGGNDVTLRWVEIKVIPYRSGSGFVPVNKIIKPTFLINIVIYTHMKIA